MSMRDTSKLNDYFRNNPGSKLIDEIKKDFENNRKAWFNSSKPKGFPFKREGFPFDNDVGIKSHLEDLAKKHPEFADDLKCPLWREDADKEWKNAFTVPVSIEKTVTNQPTSSHSRQTTNGGSDSEQQPNSTPQSESSSNASQSPKPNKQEPKRFTSKIEITPVNPYEENGAFASASAGVSGPGSASAFSYSSAAGGNPAAASAQAAARHVPIVTENYQTQEATQSPQMSRKHSEARQSPATSRKQPQVRHIPIFVEGRSEPVVSKHNATTGPTNDNEPQQEQIPLKRKLDASDNSGKTQEIPVQGKQHPQQQQQQQQQLPTEAPSPSPPPPPAPSAPKSNDPMHRIEEVHKEVDALTKEVERFVGKLRTDKEYLYLDEMLTRNLIKLDTIEVEGNENLRNARKNVIRLIQKSISLLESKVPLTESGEQSTAQGVDEDMKEEQQTVTTENTNQMDMDSQPLSSESANNENKENTAGGGGGK